MKDGVHQLPLDIEEEVFIASQGLFRMGAILQYLSIHPNDDNLRQYKLHLSLSATSQPE